MNIEKYQQYNNLDTGSTMYIENVCYLFGINIDNKISDVYKDIEKLLDFNEIPILKYKIKVGDKWFYIEKDFLECSFKQARRLELLLTENDNINNLHKLISLYCRPRYFNWKHLRYEIEPYSQKRQDFIYNYIQKNMEINVANNLLVFFYQIGTKSTININISYMMTRKKQPNDTKEYIKNK